MAFFGSGKTSKNGYCFSFPLVQHVSQIFLIHPRPEKSNPKSSQMAEMEEPKSYRGGRVVGNGSGATYGISF